MDNKKLMTILSIVVIAGLVFVYAKQGMFEDEGQEVTDYGVKETEYIDTAQGYGVSASHPLAVKAGMEVLEEGGNAADAAVVVSYVLGVVEPYGSGVGGGGEMLVYQKDDEQPTVYEYREVAPHSGRSEEHTSELQSRGHLVCRLLLEKKKRRVCTYRLNSDG